MEMTGSFEHMLALIIVSMTAYLVADLTGGEPVYDMLLSRILAVRKKIASHIRHRRILMELFVGVNSTLADTAIGEISWPSEAVIVNVRRGSEEIPPKEELHLQAGDNLFILTDTGDATALQNLAAERPD